MVRDLLEQELGIPEATPSPKTRHAQLPKPRVLVKLPSRLPVLGPPLHILLTNVRNASFSSPSNRVTEPSRLIASGIGMSAFHLPVPDNKVASVSGKSTIHG